MEITPINNINERQLHLSDILAMRQSWNYNTNYSWINKKRNCNGFCLYLKGEAQYTIINSETGKSELLNVKQGDLLYLPNASRYRVNFISKKSSTEMLLINFNLYNENFEETVFSKNVCRISKNTPNEIVELFLSITENFEKNAKCKNLLNSVLYQILFEIGNLTVEKAIQKSGFGLILPGVIFLESHLTENFSVADLSRLCNVSETYFRRLFKAYTGKTPIEYKNLLLLEKAKILLSTNTVPLNEIAERLGYFDTAYFCKIFKKQIGITPKEFIKQGINGDSI